MRFRLIPRDESFYPLFDSQATIAQGAARQLAGLIENLPASSAAIDALVSAERAGDQVIRAVRERLDTSIVTPFDPEDIQALSSALDDVVDEIRAAADLINLHHISTPLSGLTELVGLLCQACDVCVRLVNRLRTLKDLVADIDEIDRLESEGDATYRRIMADLFDGSHDALEILKWKDVIEAVEQSIDAVESVSDVVQSIAVKHA